MTAAGWIEIALYVAILTAITPLLGAYMTRIYRGELGIGLVERSIVALGGDREQDWKAYAKSVLISERRLLRAPVPDPAHAGDPPMEPQRPRLGAMGRRVQHDGVVRDQHELAVLRRRDDDVELLADGRPGRPELRLGRRRHRGRDRLHPCARLPLRQQRRQLLQRPHQDARLRPAADLGRRSASSSSRRASSSRSTAGPGRLAGGHQAARHQRRRLLQRQLRAPVREPDLALELRRAAADPRDPGRADLHLRPDGRQPPPGLGDLRARCCRCSWSP